MKNILQQLLSVVLLLNMNIVFSQTDTLEIETAFMDCLYQSLPDKGDEFKMILQEAEQKLIHKKYLKDGTGESYVTLYRNLGNTINKDFQNLGLLNYMSKITHEVEVDTVSNCAEKILKSPKYKDSKIFKITSITQSQSLDISDSSSYKDEVLSILEVKDFEHDYYKMSTLVMIETMNYVDLEGIVTKLPEVVEAKISDEERARAFKIEIQSEEIILINGKKSDFATVKKQLKRYLKDNTSESIIILKNDRSVPYIFFIKIQNEMVAAFEEIRNEESKKKFDHSFDKLTEEQQKEIKEMYPIKISEVEIK